MLDASVPFPATTVPVEPMDETKVQWRSQGGGHGGHGPPQTVGECFFSPINLRRYVLLVCK